MYIFSGGKTGGHIMPLISIIKENHNKGIYIGQLNNLEEKICKSNNIDFIGISAHKNKIIMGFKGYRLLKAELKDMKIDALITTGGYVSFAACLYAIRNNIPIFLIEENTILGSLNKVIYPFCKKLLLTYDIENNRKKRIITGLPIRSDDHKKYETIFDILVIGGSLGSKPLCQLANKLSKQYKVCLIAGRYKEDFEKSSSLTVLEYVDNIYEYIKKSRVIIARAGASTAQEIFMLNKPYICIPSMKTKANHQYYNAKFYQENKVCFMVLENEMYDRVDKIINNIFLYPEIKHNMIENQKKIFIPSATDKILDIVKENI